MASFVLTAATPAKADHPRNYRELPRDIKETIHNDASDRPKTTGEWQAEAEEVEGQPVERAKRIAKESADAVEDFAGLYPDVAERTTLQDDKVVNSR
ncbi:MAG: hypothetical protein VKK04_16020 [Synechococcales bacterium]|nr:hypothetical protein [Synechococcales bacterium]